MASSSNKLVFFLPREKKRISTLIHSSCMRLAKNLLNKSRNGIVLVPIEAMDFVAVIKGSRLYFAESDKQSQTGQLGMPIQLGWIPHLPENEVLSIQHLPMDLVLFSEQQDLHEMQQKLTGEFYRAMMLLDEKYAGQFLPVSEVEMVETALSN